jgi:hypothetical protein
MILSMRPHMNAGDSLDSMICCCIALPEPGSMTGIRLHWVACREDSTDSTHWVFSFVVWR